MQTTEQMPGVAPVIRFTPNSVRKKRSTKWLWQDFVPTGELVLVTGTTGLGKSTVCLDIAAALTRGKLPGEYFGKPVTVAYLALEDTIERDITPKLEATEADRDLFWDIGSDKPIVLPRDLDQIEENLIKTDSKALFIDPIQSVLGGDKNKAHEVRPVLEAIRHVAEKLGISVFGVIHQKKGHTGSANDGILGSSEWSNVSRSNMAIIEHREEPGTFILSVTKNNRAKQKISLIYRIGQRDIEMDDTNETQEVAKIEWLGVSDVSVDDMLAASAQGLQDNESGEAAMWLESTLTNNGGEMDKAALMKAARAAGVSSVALNAAYKRLGIDRENSLDGVVWKLP